MARSIPPPGFPVDSGGNLTVDPTKNVLDLVRAAVDRIDDLAAMRLQLQDEKVSSLRREQIMQAEIGRLRADNQEKLDMLEAKRLDAVRQVDQLAVKTEADRSAAAITALASTAATTAETLRNAVNTSASNLATQLDRTVTAITERIAALEKSSYEGMGKQKIADPQMERISTLVEALSRTRATDAGASAGSSDTVKMIALVISMFVGLIVIGTFVFVTSRSSSTVAPAPQIIYVPAPATGVPLPSGPQTAGPR